MSGLRKVDAPFTTVDNAVAEDSTLSYRARGVLLYLLAKPDGWDVRAEAIARDGKEGRDAILAVLRELGARGHYRIVRYREGGPGGRWKTSTEVSHRPVADWQQEWAANGGGPVIRKDAPASPQVNAENGILGIGAASDGPSDPEMSDIDGDDHAPESGFPASGSPSSGRSAATTKTLSNETEEPQEPADAASLDADVIEIDSKVKRDPKVQAIYETARSVVTAYMDWWKVDRGMPAAMPLPDGTREFMKLVGARSKPDNCQYVSAALIKGYTRDQIALALGHWAQGKHNGGRKPQGLVPSTGAWTEALAAVAAGREPTGGKRAAAYSNQQWEDDPTGGWGANALGKP